MKNTNSKELRAVYDEMRELSATPELAKRNELRIGVLQSIAKGLSANTVSASNATTKKWFRQLFRGELEQRGDMLAGTQSITYTDGDSGAKGGYLVPQEFMDEILIGMAQIDPLFDENIVTVVPSGDFSLRPYRVPGWDLSTFTATKVSEGAQQNAQSVPAVAGAQLNSNTYRCALPVSMELEEDAFEPTMNWMQIAYQIGLTRGIGVDLATGATTPQGIVTGAHDSGVTAASSTVLTGTDIENIYFSVNRWYRAMPKCAWVMDDTVYKMVRNAVDNNNRPLLEIRKDKEMLLGKPVYISPSMSSSAGGKAIVFGDLEYFIVRLSTMKIDRSMQAAGYAEYGKALYRGLMRADSAVFDPTGGGADSPIMFAKLHS